MRVRMFAGLAAESRPGLMVPRSVRGLAAAVGLALATLSATGAKALTFAYQTVTLPDPNSSFQTQSTYLHGINNAGVAVGGARLVLASNNSIFLDVGVRYGPETGISQFAGAGGANLAINNLGFGTAKSNKVFPDSNPSFSIRPTGGFAARIEYPGAYSTTAADINDSGDVAGYTFTPGAGFHAFLYHNPTYIRADEVYIPIADVPGSLANTTRAISINNDGDMVLLADMPGSGPQTFFYRDGRYARTDTVTPGRVVQINNVGGLISLVSDGTDVFGNFVEGGQTAAVRVPGAQFTYVRGLNDRGQVVGYYYNDPFDTVAKGFIASVAGVPEPATWATMLAGFGLMGTALRRRRREVAALPG